MVIMLAADTGYQVQLETLIKSLCYHHTNLKIYLFHKEFPLEWFEHINTLIAPLNSEIIPALVNVDLSTLKTMDHITETTYFIGKKYWFYYRLTWQEIIAKHQK